MKIGSKLWPQGW